MPSFAIPLREPRVSVIDTLERTSATSNQRTFWGEATKLRRSRQTSQFLIRRRQLEGWIAALPKLTQIPKDWNSYGAPPPSPESVSAAAAILTQINSLAMLPESIRASAEGGVAIVFTGVGRNRAIIEALNSGEEFVLIYDLEGNNKTIDWPIEVGMQKHVLENLRRHLEGAADAIG